MSRKATRIGALRERIGDEVLLEGWLYNRRSSGKLEFLLVRDGSGTVQCVAAKAELPEEVFARCATVTCPVSPSTWRPRLHHHRTSLLIGSAHKPE